MFRSLILCLLLSAVLTVPCHAAPYQAILYPNGATLFEQQKLAAGAQSITLSLPQVALPESIRVALGPEAEAAKITTIGYRSTLPKQPSFDQLRKKISELKVQITELDDQIIAAETAFNFWKKDEAIPVASLDEAKKLSDLIRSESLALLGTASKTKAQKEELERELKEAERQLQGQTGNAQRIWLVELQLSEPLAQATNLTYDYRINQAGWTSAYRLNAVPKEGQIDWSWQAEIGQRTGSDWNDIALKVATSEPVFSLTPPNNRSWVIREIEAVTYRSNAKLARTMVMSDAVEMEAPAVGAAAPPLRTEGQLFDIYELGRVSIASGKSAQIQIREGIWPAEFSYLARPLESPQAFLTAKLTFDDNFLPLPSGTASIQIDGVHVGRHSFALNEKQDVALSFGNDPSIDIKVDTAHSAGSEGLISKKETYNWNWKVTLTNNKSMPVKLRVEDSYPHIAHEDIEIEELFTPPLPVKEEDGQLSWEVQLAPGEQQMLKYGYRVSHPDGMDVSLGR